MKNLTWQNPEPLGFAASRVEELFVAQVLIKKVKLKCCGIKVIFPSHPSYRNNLLFDKWLGVRDGVRDVRDADKSGMRNEE